MKPAIEKGLYWFRNDLRLDDNPALQAMSQNVASAAFVFVIDNRWFEKSHHGLERMGAHRMRFMVESIQALKIALLEKGHQLLVLTGDPAACVIRVAQALQCDQVFGQKEHTQEESEAENRIQSAIPAAWIEGQTLLHPEDLPMSLSDLPQVFSRFRNKVEKGGLEVRTLAQVEHWPNELNVTALLESSWRQRCESIPCPPAVPESMVFAGGSLEGKKRLNAYLWDTQSLSRYKETRNGLLGWDYSSKFSPWLAWGCLSARQIHSEIKHYEDEIGANDSTYWLIFELLWRDYFRFVAMQHGSRIWRQFGIKGEATFAPVTPHEASWDNWVKGTTDDDFVNANMRELRATGFMSNRGRQNVASFAIHDLGLDWRQCASWFERELIDYDPCSNTGNWLYVAGLGNDPRPSKKFDLTWQTERYDPDGHYRAFWNTQTSHDTQPQ